MKFGTFRCLGRRKSQVRILSPRPKKTSALFAMPGFGPASAPVVDCSTLGHLGVRSSYKIDYMRTPRVEARLLVAQPVNHSDARFSIILSTSSNLITDENS
jgi:hypothetical protein